MLNHMASQSLEEVVVVGPWYQRSKVVQSSKVISNLKDERLFLHSKCQGQAAGVQVVQSSGVLGAAKWLKLEEVRCRW
jgi:hypothetical protein